MGGMGGSLSQLALALLYREFQRFFNAPAKVTHRRHRTAEYAHELAADKMLRLFHNKTTGFNRRRIELPKSSLSDALRLYCLASVILAALFCQSARAFGFSDVKVASELGQPLRATVAVTGSGMTTQTGACFTSHLKSASGTLIAVPNITVTPSRQGAFLSLATAERIVEPAVSLVVESSCGNIIHREFTLLLDPPITRFVNFAGMTSAVGGLPLPGPSSNTRRSRRSDERLRHFIIAKKTSDARRNANLSTAATLRPAQRRNAPLMHNALHMNPLDEGTTGMHRTSSLRLALTDRLVLSAAPAAPANTRQPHEMQSVQRDGAKQNQEEHGISGQLLTIVGGVLVLSLGIIALLRGRVKHSRPPAVVWDWEENNESTRHGREPTMPENAVLHEPLPATAAILASCSAPPPQAKQPLLELDRMIIGPIRRYSTCATLPMSPAAAPAVARTPAISSPMPASGAFTFGRHDDMHFPELPIASTALEEISDVMEKVEFWISLKDPKRAVEVLEPHATVEQPGSPLPWLYLFDLYMELESREKYDVLRERFHQVFNARILSWDDQARSETTLAERSIEDVPHVKAKITSLWQSAEIVPYLESLLVDNRHGTRAGFTLSVFRDIMFLIMLANTTRPAETPNDTVPGISGWTIEA